MSSLLERENYHLDHGTKVARRDFGYSAETDCPADGGKSPIPLNFKKEGFRGLEYFPIDPNYQFKLKLHHYNVPAKAPIVLSNGGQVEALRVGFLEFEIEGRKRRLQVYKKKTEDKEVFVPFKDGTSGKETYEAGRYVDVELDSSDNSCVLDFNLSYSPLCMFDQTKFVCPIPPAENSLLDLRIQAGEKKLKL